ncbi:MAG: caspase family protein [Planctomycetes bacterium]|nr:caspase family protein [Planctomycetota bacterium]
MTHLHPRQQLNPQAKLLPNRRAAGGHFDPMKFFPETKAICTAIVALATSAFCASAQVLSFDQAKQRADQGDAFAQAVVALHYQLGWNTQKNPDLAAKYAIASANAGNPLGQFRLGALMRAGEGVSKEEQKGLALQSASFNALYNAQDPYSITSAAIMIFQGKVVGQNISEDERRRDAAALYKKAADMGYAPAQFNYAMALNDGHGVPKNPDLSEQYLSRARVASYPLALNHVQESISSQSVPSIGEMGLDELRDVLPDIFNPETGVWEFAKEKGFSSAWHTLSLAEHESSITVEVRPQYNAYDVLSGRNAQEEGGIGGRPDHGHGHWPEAFQSSFTSWQHVILSSDAKGVDVGLKPGPDKKNLQAITEFPISLEFRFTNKSRTTQKLDRLVLTVDRYEPLEKVIPAIAIFPGGRLQTHNFGWFDPLPLQVDLKLFATFFDNAKSEFHTNQVDAASISGMVGAGSRTLESLFPSPQSKAVLANAFELTPEIVANFNVNGPKGSKRYITASYGLDPYPGACFYHSRVPSDFVFPSGRTDYDLVYPLGLELRPGEAASSTLSFTAERSAVITLQPRIKVVGNNRPFECLPISLRCDIARKIPDYALRTAVVRSGQSDYTPYYYASVSTLTGEFPAPGEFFDRESDLYWTGKGEDSRLGIKPLPTQEAADASFALAYDHIKEEYLVSAGRRRLLPTSQTIPAPKLFPPLPKNYSASEPCLTKDFEFRFFTKPHLDAIEGILDVSVVATGSKLSRIPWAFPRVDDELTAQVIGSPAGRWIAWLISGGGRSELFVALPDLSDCSWAIPFFEGKTIDYIGFDDTNMQLIVRAERKDYTVAFDRSFCERAASALYAGGDVEADARDVDSLGRVRLWVPVLESKAGGERAADLKIALNDADQKAEDNLRLAWPTSTLIGVYHQGIWRPWNLASGRAIEASTALVDAFEADVRKQARVWKKIPSKSESFTEPDRFFDEWERRAQTADGDVVSVGTYNSAERPFYNRFGLVKGPLRTRIGLGNFEVQHSRYFKGGLASALAPDGRKLLLVNSDATCLYFVDLSSLSLSARAVLSPVDPSFCTIVATDGYYLSGNGTADGCVFSSGLSATPLSRLEVKFNRPDIVLERLGAGEALIKEARRLRERLVRRSDFKSFDGAALIDIPVVTVKTEVPEKTGDKSLTLDFEASNSTGPLKELRVFNNGALVQTVPLTGKDGQPSRESTGEVNVDLASGENRLQLMAVSEEGFTSAFAEKRVECTAEPDSRRCFIVAVGVSEYNDPRFNLKFAAKDAEDMSKALAEKAQHRGYQPEVMVVKNAEVDGTLVEKLRKFLAQAGTDDEVVLFLAGHGLLDKDLEYHFARHDTDFDANENMGFTFQELESLVDGIKPLKRTVLFDTCHSGEVEEEDKQQLLAMVGGAAAPDAGTGVQVRGVATRGMKVKELEPKLRHADFIELESLFPDSRRAKGANILTSSSGSEFSMESDAWQNGLFTFAFLNALKDEKTDANGDKVVSFSEAAAAVQDKVKTLSGGQQRPITRGVNREAEVALASFGPPVASTPTKEKTSGWWPF